VTIRVLVVDDHAVVRTGLQQLLSAAPGLEVVGLAADGAEAVLLAAELRPDVILMDLSMPVLDGTAATAQILAADPDARVVVLTSLSDDRHIAEALSAGAIGYLLKHASPDELFGAVHAAHAGDVPLDPKAARVLMQRSLAGRNRATLSAREEEVLRLVMGGLANKQIGRRLGITERTVKAHLTHVFAAINVADRTQAALWAKEHLPPQ
jgi:DNA-binding NarL/FixJ family response regulator